MTASFPASLPTTASLRGNLVDNLATALSIVHTAGVTTITVDDTSNFPSAGLLSIQRADGTGNVELCSYTAKTATSFTGVTRNFNSRYNSAWVTGDVVALFFAADHFNHLVEELIAIATLLGSNSQHVDLTARAGLGFKLKSPNGTIFTFTVDDSGNWTIS